MRLNELGQFFTKVFVFNSVVNNQKQLQPKSLAQDQRQGLLKTSQQSVAVKLLKTDIKQAQVDIQQLANKETVQYLKDALGFPENFSNLMKQMSLLQNAQGKILTAQQMRTFLESSVKNALGKLSKDIKEISKLGYKNDLLSDVLKVATNLFPTNETTPSQMMKTLTLLYLPWLPLGEHIDFEMYFGDSESGAEGGEDDCSITIVIQTVHYGLVKLFLMSDVDDPTKINVKISCPDEFPKQELETELQQEKGKMEHQIAVVYERVKLQKISLENAKQKIDFQTQTSVNPFLMSAAFKLVKQIIEIDKRTELRFVRQQQLPQDDM